jgi:transcriptional regulator with XRE-family HTH domain
MSSDTYGDKRKHCFHNSRMSIHIRLKRARKAAGLTQDAVAVKFGITRTAVSLWESGGELGTKPDIRKLQELATLYNTSVEALLGSDEKAPAEHPALSVEQQQLLALAEGIDEDARKAIMTLLSKLFRDRRKDDVGHAPERRRPHFGIPNGKRLPKASVDSTSKRGKK